MPISGNRQDKLMLRNFCKKNNFVLEFKPHVIDKVDIYGVPRIWRKVDPEVYNSQVLTLDHKINQFVINIDTFSGGKLRKIKKSIKNN